MDEHPLDEIDIKSEKESDQSQTIADSLSSHDPIIRKMAFKKNDPGQPSYDYIYQPSSARITTLLRFILKLLYDRQIQINNLHGNAIHPNYFPDLLALKKELAATKNINEHEKSPRQVSDALKQMLNFFEGCVAKLGYIYPHLTSENGKIKPLLVLYSPQTEKQTPILSFRKACFIASLPIIQKLQSRTHKMADIRPNFLFGSYKGKPWLFPRKGSIEIQITSILRKGFEPYDYIPQTDFIHDFTEYGIESDSLLQILPDYHIVESKLELNEDGNLLEEPELLFQLRIQAYSLERFHQEYLYPQAQKRGFAIFQSRFEEYQREYQEEDILNGPLPDTDRLEDLFVLSNDFPFVEANDKDLFKAREACELAIKLLKSIQKHQQQFNRKKDQTILKNFLKVQENKIINHTREKQTLIILDVDTLLKNSGLQDKNLEVRLRKDFMNLIHEQYGYFEGETSGGKTYLYALDPGYMTSVKHNLRLLSLTNDAYEKQYQIACQLEEKLKLTSHNRLDKNLDALKIQDLQQEIDRIERELEKKRRKQDFLNRFNIIAGIISFIVTLGSFVMLASYLELMIIMIPGLIISLFSGIALAFLFSRSRRQGLAGTTDDNSQLNNKEPITAVLKATQGKLFKTDFHLIEEKFFDRKSLKNAIIENLNAIIAESSYLQKQKDREKVIATIENAVLHHSAVIIIPREIIPKNKSDAIILDRSDLKSPLFRSQLADHFRALASIQRSDSHNQYYNFILNCIEVEYPKYIRKKSIHH